jgi:hypothetical protein
VPDLDAEPQLTSPARRNRNRRTGCSRIMRESYSAIRLSTACREMSSDSGMSFAKTNTRLHVELSNLQDRRLNHGQSNQGQR